MGWPPLGRGQEPGVGGMGQGCLVALPIYLKEGEFVCYLSD